MANLINWDTVGSRNYETGVDHVVLFPQSSLGTYPQGVAWSGVVSINESPSGAEPTPFFADNMKYLNLLSAEEFAATIEAYTYPDEFGECDGSVQPVNGVSIGQQQRKPFGLAYRTLKGNDVDAETAGFKIHLIYGALASPSEKAFSSVNDSPEPIAFSWELSTTPVPVEGYRPTSQLVIDSNVVDPTKLAAFLDILYGTEGTPDVAARLPLPNEVLTLFAPG